MHLYVWGFVIFGFEVKKLEEEVNNDEENIEFFSERDIFVSGKDDIELKLIFVDSSMKVDIIV